PLDEFPIESRIELTHRAVDDSLDIGRDRARLDREFLEHRAFAITALLSRVGVVQLLRIRAVGLAETTKRLLESNKLRDLFLEASELLVGTLGLEGVRFERKEALLELLANRSHARFVEPVE